MTGSNEFAATVHVCKGDSDDDGGKRKRKPRCAFIDLEVLGI